MRFANASLFIFNLFCFGFFLGESIWGNPYLGIPMTILNGYSLYHYLKQKH